MQQIQIVAGKRRKLTEIILHIVVWVLLFSFPLLFSTNELPKSSTLFFRAWMPIFFSAILFYLNYFLFIDKLVFNKRLIWFLVLNAVLFAVCIYFIDFLRELLSPPREGRSPFRESRFYYFVTIRQVFSFALTVGVAFAIKAISKWQQTEVARKNLENENLKSELKHLKYQIQPHFFLNTLNNIYALTDLSPEKAKEAIHSLGKLMRYLLYDTNTDHVSLRKEIDFIEKYISLMKMRLRDEVKVDYSFPAVIEEVQLPPLLLIPLVENAFKHGISADKPSFIYVELLLDKDNIVFTVKNSNFPKDYADQGGSGIGIENLNKRLMLLYGSEAEFSQSVKGQEHISYLKLPLQ